MKTWMTYGFDKIVADKPAPSNLKKTFALYLTKGGKGNCQIVVNSDKDTSVTLKTVSCDGVKCEIFTADHTLPINGHQYTDPILPYGGEAIVVKGGMSLPFFLDFKAEEAGDYTATFELCENGAIETFTVSLHVWSLRFPRIRPLRPPAELARRELQDMTNPRMLIRNIMIFFSSTVCAVMLSLTTFSMRGRTHICPILA